MRTKQQQHIEPGDIILFLGTPHRVERIDPPTEATLAINPECVGFARASDGWGITLSGGAFRTLEVV